MWKVSRIDEADYGCEERMSGQPLMVRVTLVSEEGGERVFHVSDDWLIEHNIDEGDEWPEDMKEGTDGN